MIFSAFVNLALHKPAYQSSTSWNGTADLAVDGDTTKNYFKGSCTHTASDYYAWWTVDLQHEYRITKVKIHERDDAGADGKYIYQIRDFSSFAIPNLYFKQCPIIIFVVNEAKM